MTNTLFSYVISFDIWLRQRAKDDTGAVTVDYVVLTAAIATVGLVTLSIIRGGVYEVASDIYSSLTSYDE